MQPLQILLTAALLFCASLATLSCQRIIDRAESALECDEEVDIDFKFKVDFKDKAEREATIGSQ